MDSIIVTTKEQLTVLIENAVGKFLKSDKPKEPEPDNLSGTKEAVLFLNQNGYSISLSLFTKQTAKGIVPCRRFHNRRLIFSKRELLNWAENQCIPIVNGKDEIVLLLAKSANRKLAGPKEGGRKWLRKNHISSSAFMTSWALRPNRIPYRWVGLPYTN